MAKKAEGLFKYPAGRTGLEGSAYDEAFLKSLPEEALSEAFRVLNPGGRCMIADQVLAGPLDQDRDERIKSWCQ